MNGNGDIGLGYSISSTSLYPSIRYTGRLPGSPLGQMTLGEGSIVNGAATKRTLPALGRLQHAGSRSAG